MEITVEADMCRAMGVLDEPEDDLPKGRNRTVYFRAGVLDRIDALAKAKKKTPNKVIDLLIRTGLEVLDAEEALAKAHSKR